METTFKTRSLAKKKREKEEKERRESQTAETSLDKSGKACTTTDLGPPHTMLSSLAVRRKGALHGIFAPERTLLATV